MSLLDHDPYKAGFYFSNNEDHNLVLNYRLVLLVSLIVLDARLCLGTQIQRQNLRYMCILCLGKLVLLLTKNRSPVEFAGWLSPVFHRFCAC